MGKIQDSLKSLKKTMASGSSEEWKGKPSKSVSKKNSSSSLKSRSDIPEERETLSKREKRKLKKKQTQEAASDDESEEDDVSGATFDTAALDDSDDSEDEDFAADSLIDDEAEEDSEDGSDKEEDEEEEVPLSDVELDEDADVVPYQKTTINNKKALESSFESIALKTEKLPFYERMVVDHLGKFVLKDIHDDIERELAFYKQGLEAANEARRQLKKEKIPFSRPVDYFAEMVKSDEHMEQLKQKLIEEKTAEKASQEAKRQRELKKFGKKVQHAKLQERQKEKRETLDKIKSLKRKRGNNEMTTEDFDIALEEAASNDKSKRPAEKSAKRKAKDAKYGSGGKKRFKNTNDAKSSADMSDFSHKKMKSGIKSKRPGRSKRNKK